MDDDATPEFFIDDDDPRYLKYLAGESPWIFSPEEIEEARKVPKPPPGPPRPPLHYKIVKWD